ncbi:unnamed protein product [Calicophoron daubneyi]|uniref:Acyltransferase n=1 Tax=Calicophoron daubneyi TaxID=300641 RepID=A0AAV2T3M2_CALDB
MSANAKLSVTSVLAVDVTAAKMWTEVQSRWARFSDLIWLISAELVAARGPWTRRSLTELLCTGIYIMFFLFSSLSGMLLWCFIAVWLTVRLYDACEHFKAGKELPSSADRANWLTLVPEWDFLQLSVVLVFFLTYQLYWLADRGAEDRGGHPKAWIRTLFIWKYVRDFFPVHLVLSEEIVAKQESEPKNEENMEGRDKILIAKQVICKQELFPASRNYLVGYHPHGIFGVGALINFGTEANQFSSKFPGLTPWLSTLKINFKAPFHRDIVLSLNVVAATYEGLMHLLDPNRCGKTGNFVVVVLGGAPEALDSRPGKYIFHTNKRYGFFKLALMTGSALVPCVSFGEVNMYKQMKNPVGSSLRTWQDRFTEFATFSPPLFYARGLIPYRTPVNTVVGEPITVEQTDNPSREQVSALKALYLEKLKALFHQYKGRYDPQSSNVEFF